MSFIKDTENELLEDECSPTYIHRTPEAMARGLPLIGQDTGLLDVHSKRAHVFIVTRSARLLLEVNELPTRTLVTHWLTVPHGPTSEAIVPAAEAHKGSASFLYRSSRN